MAFQRSGTGSPSGIGLEPVVGSAPVILILGSFPGTTSLAELKYYAHPQNQFWQIMEQLFDVDRHLPYARRTKRLARRGIALWDVIATCQREGSADNRITDPVLTPLSGCSHPTRPSAPLRSTGQPLHGTGLDSGFRNTSARSRCHPRARQTQG
jgi:hypothetical protein